MAIDEIASGGLSRRRLLTGSAGLAGMLAGAGLLGPGRIVPGAEAAGTDGAGAYHLRMSLAGIGNRAPFGAPIVLQSYSWGLTDVVGGIRTTKPDFNSLTVTKSLDAVSPLILQACYAGTVLQQGAMNLSYATAEVITNVLTVGLKNVVIASVITDGAADAFTETIQLAFSQINIEYFYRDAGGKVQVAAAGWDLVANKPL